MDKKRNDQFARTMLSSWKFRWFLLNRLPSVWFWGVRINQLNRSACTLTLPFRWSTKNPFRSTYFAALSGAAELASGVLCMQHISERGSFSMLVTHFEAEFHKKATKTTTFVCADGEKLSQLLDTLASPGSTGTLQMDVNGVDPDGRPIASFRLTWSFKNRLSA